MVSYQPTVSAASTVAVLGAGSWGTAVAIHLARHHQRVLLWSARQTAIQAMTAQQMNQTYLPNITFPPTLIPVSDLTQAVKEADDVIIALPSQAFAEFIATMPKPAHGLCWLTKGLDPTTNDVLSHTVRARWGEELPVAVISGPSFAKEVAKGLPTALVLAGNHAAYLQKIQQRLHHQSMRVYISDDLMGVQLAGAVKNVLAIACGISDGLAFGANARAALITRGLAEMSRLGLAYGARQETFMGLAGLGDLVLTCTDNQSRNRRFGLLLGEEMAIDVAEARIGQVVEGKHNAMQVAALAARFHIELPICSAVLAIIERRITPEEAVKRLMNRPPKEE